MFQTKNFGAIAASMIAHMRATQDNITDFRVGAVARTLVEAPAVELDEFYQRVLFGLLEAIPTAIYHAFNFDRLPAAAAGGKVRFSAATLVVSDVPIPLGTEVQSAETRQRYVTTEAGVISAGTQYADVRVVSQLPGADSNAASGTVTQMVSYVAQVVACNNLNPLVGGLDAEGDAERQERFLAYIGSLSRGTVWAINYAAKSSRLLADDGHITEYVTRAGIDERAGTVFVHLYGSAGTPSSELLAEADKNINGRGGIISGETEIPGYRPAGVEVVLQSAVERLVAMTFRLTFLYPSQTIDAPLIAAVRSKLDAALFALVPGGVLSADEIVDVVLSVPGVKTCVFVSTSNVVCAIDEVLRLGTLTLTQGE